MHGIGKVLGRGCWPQTILIPFSAFVCTLVSPCGYFAGENAKSGSGFMVVAEFTNLISRHVQTFKTSCRLTLVYNRFVDLQQNRRYTTTMNPDPESGYVQQLWIWCKSALKHFLEPGEGCWHEISHGFWGINIDRRQSVDSAKGNTFIAGEGTFSRCRIANSKQTPPLDALTLEGCLLNSETIK